MVESARHAARTGIGSTRWQVGISTEVVLPHRPRPTQASRAGGASVWRKMLEEPTPPAPGGLLP
eukprot:9892237-Alexandrium_andersonii.AAC.1